MATAFSSDQPRFERMWWRRWSGRLMATVLVVLASLFAVNQPLSHPVRPVEGNYQVARVIDGDTLLLSNGMRVRLQGIDTPETVHPDRSIERLGPEASAFTTRFVERAGGRVRLTFGTERVDRYDRWLAFAWHDEQMLNEAIVREGLAKARLDYRYAGKMKRRLRVAQDDARAARRGVWSIASP